MYIVDNFYAPNQNHKIDQNNFIIKVKSLLAPFENETMIIWGDFNFDINPKLNKRDPWVRTAIWYNVK